MLIEVLEGKIVSVMQTIEEQQVKKCELRDFFFLFCGYATHGKPSFFRNLFYSK